jgi:predicted AAA+ superfamily ATPase
MFPRIINIPQSKSFFLFGARGVGKSTLLKHRLNTETTHTINLLKAREEDRFTRDPDLFVEVVNGLSPQVSCVVIDEIQKVPKLLDLVHLLIEESEVKRQFILTGSSARKLKRGQANLLAGRAVTRNLYPLSAEELGDRFQLATYLKWGGLPEIWNQPQEVDRSDFLEAYATVFIKEEIQAEQIVRQLGPFRRFIEVAAQCNGKILNYSKMSRDIGADPKTIKSYYEVLVDTLIGFYIEAYHTSRRKRLVQAPKFYFFDPGIARALARYLEVAPVPSTSYYGELFEHFIILEIFKKSEYNRLNYRLNYLRTEDQAEVDLVIERPGKAIALVEIKSKQQVHKEDLRHLLKFSADFPDAEAYCFSQDSLARTIDGVTIMHWKEGIKVI